LVHKRNLFAKASKSRKGIAHQISMGDLEHLVLLRNYWAVAHNAHLLY